MSASVGPPSVVLDADLVARLHARAGAAQWDVTPIRFAEALARAVAKQMSPGAHAGHPAAVDPAPAVDVDASEATPAGASASVGGAATRGAVDVAASLDVALDAAVSLADVAVAAAARLAEGLHLEDLALSVACADGHEAAWAAFLRTHQAPLRRAAIAIAGGDHGEDLADALVADLYGLDPKGTGRRSLFEYFHGRSRLSTWLRALLSRRHIDALRAGRRTRSLDALERPEELLQDRIAVAPPDPDRARLAAAMQQALDAALASLAPDERLRIACYHVDQMTLAQMARQFGEHEATASRKLQRIRQALRTRIDEHLRQALRLGPDEIRDCYRAALDEGTVALAGLAPAAAPAAPGLAPAAVPAAIPGPAPPQGPASAGPRQESAADTF